jgi:tRNA pseudouridine38-40 synthase
MKLSTPKWGFTVTRVRVDLSYDGCDFHGWAVQPGKRTVQGTLELALYATLFPHHYSDFITVPDTDSYSTLRTLNAKQPLKTCVAGRTDAKVHALQQTAHFDIEKNNLRIKADEGKSLNHLRYLLNKTLTNDVYIKRLRIVSDHFNARFSAVSRTYIYQIADANTKITPFMRNYALFLDYALDLDAINCATKQILGVHDFKAFSKLRPNSTTIRDLKEFSFKRNEKKGNLITATITADAFTHNMVRSLISACIFIGRHKNASNWLKEKLESKLREGKTGPVAPQGLFLKKIDYPKTETEIIVQNNKSKQKRLI